MANRLNIMSTEVGSYGYDKTIKIDGNIKINTKGQAWGWGYNYYGELGNNSVICYSTPVTVCGNHTFCEISRGGHTIALDTYQAWCWGYNYYGELGNNSVICYSTPVTVCGNHTFCKISAGLLFSIGLNYQGKLWSWGYNGYGELGNNSVICYSTPVTVCGNHTFCEISCGQLNVLSLDNHYKAWGWGWNSVGVGDNSIINKSTPVAVCGNHTFCKISAGGSNSMGIDNHGKAWSWGYNGSGRLGNNTNVLSQLTPVSVYGTHTFCKISVGGSNSMGIDNHGKAWSWGYNGSGQLGNYTINIEKCTPVAVCGNHTFCEIFIKDLSLFALDNNSKVWSWGHNYYGTLGDNTTSYRSTPIAVCSSLIPLGFLIALKTTPESANNHLSYLEFFQP